MSLEITGKLKLIKETQSFGSNGFTKREFVITTDDQYPQHIILEVVKDKCIALDKFNVGDEVKAFVNVRGREWINPEGVSKYFNTLQVWKLQNNDNGQANTPTSSVTTQTEEPDDLPF